ncbi:unnamed protein product [Urochloa humidicola]
MARLLRYGGAVPSPSDPTSDCRRRSRPICIYGLRPFDQPPAPSRPCDLVLNGHPAVASDPAASRGEIPAQVCSREGMFLRRPELLFAGDHDDLGACSGRMGNELLSLLQTHAAVSGDANGRIQRMVDQQALQHLAAPEM